MRILVTGASGFVGGHLCEHLLEAGDVVVGLSAGGRWPRALEHVGRLVRNERLDLADADEAELVELLGRKRPEAIIHLAAQSDPQLGLADPRGTWAVNLVGTLNLLEAVRAAAQKPRVLLASSGVVYGRPRPGDQPVTEACPLRPQDPYAASKAAADLLGLQHALGYGTDVIIARPFNHAGPRQPDRYALSSFARQVAEAERGLRPGVEVGDLDVVRDYTDVRDIVRAYRLLLLHGRPGETYNIGTGRDISLAEMLNRLIAMAQVPVPVRVDPARLRPNDQRRLLADASRLRAATGWEPLYTPDQTLRDLLDHWRSLVPTRAAQPAPPQPGAEPGPA